MTPQTLPDITPGGTATPLTTDPNIKGVWVTIAAPKGNSGDVRAGDSNTDASRGAAIAPGSSFTFLRGDFEQQSYQLNAIYVYASSSDKATITYGN